MTTIVHSTNDSELHTASAAGAAWVHKYIHPPGPMLAEYAGVPDHNNSPSCRLEFTNISNIPCADGQAMSPSFYDRILVLTIPSLTLPAITWRFSSFATPAAGSPIINYAVSPNPSTSTFNLITNASSARIAYKSTTLYLNSNSVNNQGTVSTAQFRPEITIIGTISASVSLPNIDHPRNRNFRDKHFGLGVADQFVHPVIMIWLGQMPTSDGDIAMLSPNSTTTPAKDGAFIVNRLLQPTNPYRQFLNGNQFSAIYPPLNSFQGAVLAYSYVVPDPADPTQLIVVYQPVFIDPSSSSSYLDVGTFDFNCSWTLFSGLSVSPNGASAVTPPYITMKSITGVELQPLMRSSFVPFVKNSANLDTPAIDFASTVVHSAPDCLPAAANDWGSTIGKLIRLAPTAVSSLTRIFKHKPRAISQPIPIPQNKNIRRNPPTKRRNTVPPPQKQKTKGKPKTSSNQQKPTQLNNRQSVPHSRKILPRPVEDAVRLLSAFAL